MSKKTQAAGNLAEGMEFPRFKALARAHTLVPVWKRLAADLETPVGAYLKLAQPGTRLAEPQAFLLESVEGGERLGRWTFMGTRPSAVLEARGDALTVREGRKVTKSRGDMFAAFQAMLSEHVPAEVVGLPPFQAGAVGYLAYDAVRQIEKLPAINPDETGAADAVLMFFRETVAFDHVRKEMVLVVQADVRGLHGEKLKAAYEAAQRQLRSLEKRLARPMPLAKKMRVPHVSILRRGTEITSRTRPSTYLKAVARAKEYISAGDVFQVVLSQRYELEPGVPPFEIYRSLRRLNPSPYLYFLQMGERVALGSSPETLVRVTGRKIEYRPIAGTRPRSADDAEDARLAEEMRGDPKEVAEHVMLVDLGRNDVGRVSEYGSVKVKELMAVEKYSHVMHLVSSLEGTLRKELTAIDALRACFPAGTLSGAPKVRAMEIIEELEPVRRGVYGGAVLYADARGNLDSCIAIRGMYLDGGKGYVQAGAGIVADSMPQKEAEECANKAGAVLRAVELSRGER
jgi:anthranilate synthase component 1